MPSSANEKVDLLRHTVATLAYRGGKALRGAPASFSAFQAAPGVRTPGQILAHLGDLMDWVLSLAKGNQEWHNSPPRTWDEDSGRFFAALKAFDDYLASGAPLSTSPEKLFQGAIADSLTHVGQINILRRIAGAPIRGENYYRADIATGRVGAEQSAPKREFD
ncbi:MAG: hypothetical protein WCB14_11170 [Candidatus Acidiferrales bacterium]